jgi:hypothetical protein
MQLFSDPSMNHETHEPNEKIPMIISYIWRVSRLIIFFGLSESFRYVLPIRGFH